MKMRIINLSMIFLIILAISSTFIYVNEYPNGMKKITVDEMKEISYIIKKNDFYTQDEIDLEAKKQILREFCEKQFIKKIEEDLFYFTKKDENTYLASYVFKNIFNEYYIVPIDSCLIYNEEFWNSAQDLEFVEVSKDYNYITIKLFPWVPKRITENDAIRLKQYAVLKNPKTVPHIFDDEKTKEFYEKYAEFKEAVIKEKEFEPEKLYGELIIYMGEYRFFYRYEGKWFTY